MRVLGRSEGIFSRQKSGASRPPRIEIQAQGGDLMSKARAGV